MDDFQGAGRFVVADQGALVEQLFDHAPGVAKERRAQTLFEALDDLGDRALAEGLADAVQEALGFAVALLRAMRLEFFFALVEGERSAGLEAERVARLWAMANSANSAVSWSKRRPFSRS
jgi:hypothetical protein